MSELNASELLAQVEKSPAAVAIHDKAAWMSIFAKYHIVEDPVGSTPHVSGVYDGKSGQRGNGALGRFFDTFIAPNQIAFDVQKDTVCANHVVRDLTINIQMSDQVHVQVPMHLLYELAPEGEEWKIQRLAAHWELMPMIGQLMGKGLACLGVLGPLTLRMLRLQGIAGMLGFSKAALNIGKAGKKQVLAFEQAFNKKSLSALMDTFCSDAEVIAMPYGTEAFCPSKLIDLFDGELKLSKLLASGDTITATMGWTIGDEVKQGLALFEFNRKRKKISALRFYF